MSKELEYEINNFANLLHKDCMNLMESLKKQSEDNKPILYLGKHYEKVILPYEEYQKMCNRLESIDNANPSEALECLEFIENKLRGLRVECERIKNHRCDDVFIQEHTFDTIKQALLKAQEPKQYVDELKLVEKEHKDLDLLMQELDCKDFAELRKYARCGYQTFRNAKGANYDNIIIDEAQEPKQYLKWEDFIFKHTPKTIDVKMGENKYTLVVGFNVTGCELVILRNKKQQYFFLEADKQFFNDLHLERVEE